MAPITSTTERAVSESSNSGDMRATMKMPAVTMVAAWISAEIGVGPSIESGSQTCSGNCALLPIAPTNRQMQISVIGARVDLASCAGACANTAGVVERAEVRQDQARCRGGSRSRPTRLTRNAFRLA